jgi:hypothetical protein
MTAILVLTTITLFIAVLIMLVALLTPVTIVVCHTVMFN